MMKILEKIFGKVNVSEPETPEPESTVPISQEEIKLVQESFALVAPIAPQAAEIFYTKLFELDPNLKPLFKGDMVEQGQKLMTMISTAVNSLNNIEALVPAVQDLGKRHVGYGVEAKDYDTVGAALIDTLATGLGEKFTPEVKDAWVTTYTLLSSTMKEAAYEAEPA